MDNSIVNEGAENSIWQARWLFGFLAALLALVVGMGFAASI